MQDCSSPHGWAGKPRRPGRRDALRMSMLIRFFWLLFIKLENTAPHAPGGPRTHSDVTGRAGQPECAEPARENENENEKNATPARAGRSTQSPCPHPTSP